MMLSQTAAADLAKALTYEDDAKAAKRAEYRVMVRLAAVFALVAILAAVALLFV
jgi:hypothetical protein